MATTNKNPWLVSNENTGSYGNNENAGSVQQAQKPEASAERTEGSDDNSDATGVENVRYDKVTMQGGPRVPRNGAQVAAEGLTKTAVELARPDAPQGIENSGSNAGQTSFETLDADTTRGYDQQIAMLREAAARTADETKAQREAREKRERSRKIVSAVSDGLNALSNLWWTSQYAPNMYEHKELSQLDPLRRQYERMRQEREANRDKHLQYVLRLGDVYNVRDKALRGAQAARIAARLATAKDAREAAKGDAEIARTMAQKRWYDAKAKAEPVKAQAAKDKAKKGGSGRRVSGGGAGRPAEYPWYDRNGNLNWSHSYEAMRQNALREGTWIESTGTSTRTTHNSVTDANETTTTPNKGRSAKPEGIRNTGYANAATIDWNKK